MPRLILSAAMLLILAAPAAADVQIFRKLIRSSAMILTEGGLGSGVIVDRERRLILTNEHVVGSATTVQVVLPEFRDGRQISDREHYQQNLGRLAIRGRVLARDRKRDVALVQAERLPAEATAVTLANMSAANGESVHSIGNPGDSGACWVYTTGEVRAVYFKRYPQQQRAMQVLETAAPINPGDSGGPVVNREGELVAIVQGWRDGARLITYCVDITEIQAFLKEVQSNRPEALLAAMEQAQLHVVSENAQALATRASDSPETPLVHVAKSAESYRGVRTRRLVAVGRELEGTPPIALLGALLQQNAQTKLGGWALERVGEERWLVVYAAQIDADAESAELAQAVRYVSRMAAALVE